MSKNSKPSVSKAEKLLFERVLSDVKPIENVGPFSSSGQEAVKIRQRTQNNVRKNMSTQTKNKPSLCNIRMDIRRKTINPFQPHPLNAATGANLKRQI